MSKHAETVAKCFEEAQRASNKHSDHTAQLHSLFLRNSKAFIPAFLTALGRFLTSKLPSSVHRPDELPAELLSKFLTKLITKDAREDLQHFGVKARPMTLFAVSMKSLITHASSANKNVRFRALQLLEAVSTSAGYIPEALAVETAEIFFERCEDKIATVRAQAVLGLVYIPYVDDSLANDAVIARLSDKVAQVRWAALKVLQSDEVKYPAVRVFDSSPIVRKLAFSVIKEFDIQKLSVAGRVSVVHQGFTDTSSDVSDLCLEVVHQWWKQDCNGSIGELFSMLGANDENEDKVVVIYDRILREFNVPDSVLKEEFVFPSPGDGLDGSFIVGFHRVIAHAITVGNDDLFEELAPDMVVLCEALREGMDGELMGVVYKHFFQLSELLDTRDEESRRCFVDLCSELLNSFSLSHEAEKAVVEHGVQAILQKGEARKLFDLLNDLQGEFHAILAEKARAEAEDDELDAVGAMAQKQLEFGLLKRWFGVVESLLSHIDTTKSPRVSAELANILTLDDILRGFSYIAGEESELLELSVRCLGLYSIFMNDDRSARMQMGVLYQIFQTDSISFDVRKAGIMSCFDLALLFGIFNLSESDDGDEMRIFEYLESFLAPDVAGDEETECLRLLVVQGFCKLFFHARLGEVSERIIDRLMELKDSDPDSETLLTHFFRSLNNAEVETAKANELPALEEGVQVKEEV